MVVVAVIAVVFVVRLSGYKADCFSGVTSLSSELRLSSAGTVVSSKTAYDGGYTDCADPAMSVVLSGAGANARVEGMLKGAGFVYAAGLWTRGDDTVQVSGEPGNRLQVILHAKPHAS